MWDKIRSGLDTHMGTHLGLYASTQLYVGNGAGMGVRWTCIHVVMHADKAVGPVRGS